MIIEDTFGMHKGETPTKKKRTMLILEYGNSEPIHFSKKEKNIGDSLSKLLDDSVNFHLIEPTASIEELLYNINSCDVFCSGSTGPLHVAGALNKRTIAFYPIKQSSTHLRWQTINDFDKRIEFSDIGGDKKSISINTKKVLLEIQKFLNFS